MNAFSIFNPNIVIKIGNFFEKKNSYLSSARDIRVERVKIVLDGMDSRTYWRRSYTQHRHTPKGDNPNLKRFIMVGMILHTFKSKVKCFSLERHFAVCFESNILSKVFEVGAIRFRWNFFYLQNAS